MLLQPTMAKYAATHVNPQGPGDSRPTALEIVQDEGLQGKLGGKVVLLTGASAGLGVETARALHSTGARLFLTTRDMAKVRGLEPTCSKLSPAYRCRSVPFQVVRVHTSPAL